MNRLAGSLVSCVLALVPALVSAAPDYRLEAGPLTLEIYITKTANLFHCVDQLAQWSKFCHRQYLAYFEGLEGGIDKRDRDLLGRHGTVRRSHGWGQGLEQTFYTSRDLDAALALGVKEGRLRIEESQTEREVLMHFQNRVERLMTRESPTLREFAERLQARCPELVVFANSASQFVGGAKLTVPVYLMANPHERNCGGGFNGGRLTLEIAKNYDMYPMLLHELFHAFIRTKSALIESAVRSVPGLDVETLSEGLAYAYSPGLIQAGNSGQADQLASNVARFIARGPLLNDSFARFNTYGLALRPLLKDAFFGGRQTLEGFLPRATDAWLVVSDLEKARTAGSAFSGHNYRDDPRHSIFVFGGDEDSYDAVKSGDRHLFGRRHDAVQYRQMLTKNAKPGDTILLLLALDSSGRVPQEFADLMPLAWPDVAGLLKQNQTVFRQGKSREMNVFLLAVPSAKSLQHELRRLIAEGKLQLR